MRELAHELRDALSPLASSADLARLRKFDPEASRLLAYKVERGLRRALAILDAFVLAEQCEAGNLPLQLRSVPLDEILQGTTRALGESHGHSFPRAAAGATVRADAARSIQVLAAVLQHAAAIAASPQPLEVSRAGTPAQPELRVRGRLEPGNAPSADWFDSFRGGDARMALRTARRIMILQGGDLEFLPQNDGAFELALRFADSGTPPEEEHGQGKHRESYAPARATVPGPGAPSRATGIERILIVEDSPEVRRTYREALLALGYEVIEAADAEQALGVLEGSAADAALIDIHLPRMNGYRLAQTIRARVGAAIHLVMLSGMALDTVTRALAREAGFDDCLDKMAGPIALRELLEAGANRGTGAQEK
ncbi:MAG: response regulator [Gammaproteobacteria bacterium]|nr:response regulator [Gammaproteobacteria bacterium]